MISLLSSLFYSAHSFSQTTDSLLVTVTKEKMENGLHLYNVTMKNFSDTPVCILHSIFINLFYDPAQQLAVIHSTSSAEFYSLSYSAKDTTIDYEGPINNFNAEIILPLQEIKFRLLLSSTSNKVTSLEFEYARIANLCYPEFKQAIFRDATQWHKKYKRIQRAIALP